ncbi:ParM/StbA family protein [Robertmurraya korlensis]|uniref:ParM/StbA family protein n=1 Tax=Robertmurraya korlensis TaxID=519977 RepID=UPI00203BB878|nr:ParM/StbA family protein [Robertmurraya korlensis]MCM3599418.1 ParM/StbA family protein [Robertmurraya korlensis]
MIVGIDAGNYRVKVCGPQGLDIFSSTLGEFRERRIKNTPGKDDMIFEFEGRKGFAGSLADAESEFGGSIMGDSKAHEDAKLRIFLALHRYSQTTNQFQIIVGQPISKHTEEEKKRIKDMLKGSHEITVNDKTKVIRITHVEVAAEGGASFWSKPKDGLVRIIDVGSATVNCASLLNKRYIDKDSFTLPFGLNTVVSSDLSALARGIVTHTTKKWNNTDKGYLVGGAAEKLLPYIQQYYPNIEVMKPMLECGDDPIYANAIGFYKIGCSVYGKVNQK